MYGVVLWSDQFQRRAVFWCEDHGNLAFFDGEHSKTTGNYQPDTGDFVRFELIDTQKIRRASNPQLVARDEYPSLANDLRSAGQQMLKNTQRKGIRAKGDAGLNIVPFAACPELPDTMGAQL